MGHNIYCTAQMYHVLDTAELDEFLLTKRYFGMEWKET